MRPLTERFWEKVNKNGPVILPELGPCWLWTGAAHPLGYGISWEDGKLVRATHVSIYLETGKWTELHACHRCDNPSCVRFTHLFEGTRSDNIQDAVKKGRLKPWNKGLSKLSQTDRENIKDEYSQGGISQRALGHKYGIEHAFVGRIVRGEP